MINFAHTIYTNQHFGMEFSQRCAQLDRQKMVFGHDQVFFFEGVRLRTDQILILMTFVN